MCTPPNTHTKCVQICINIYICIYVYVPLDSSSGILDVPHGQDRILFSYEYL